MSDVEPNQTKNTIIKGMLMMDRPHPRSAFNIPIYSQLEPSIHRTIRSDIAQELGPQKQIVGDDTPLMANSDPSIYAKRRREKYTRTWIGKPQKRILIEWVARHANNPYPTNEEKVILCQQTGLTLAQLNTWFVNIRRRDLAISKTSIKGVPIVSNSGVMTTYQQFNPQLWYAQYAYQMRLAGKPVHPNTATSQ